MPPPQRRVTNDSSHQSPTQSSGSDQSSSHQSPTHPSRREKSTSSHQSPTHPSSDHDSSHQSPTQWSSFPRATRTAPRCVFAPRATGARRESARGRLRGDRRDGRGEDEHLDAGVARVVRGAAGVCGKARRQLRADAVVRRVANESRGRLGNSRIARARPISSRGGFAFGFNAGQTRPRANADRADQQCTRHASP